MTSGDTSYNQLYRQLKIDLSQREPDNAANEAVWLFCHVTGQTRDWLLCHGGEAADPHIVRQCLALAQRRAMGEPLQYLLGRWEFYGLELLVGPGVLIPRPETELLVELGLAHVAAVPSPFLLDLCSGSGCVPIALGHTRQDAQVWGVELYPQAYQYFAKNILHTGTEKNVTPVEGDVFALPGQITARRYHLMTANPPYITTTELETLQAEVRMEPETALLGGVDGLDYYRELPKIAARLLLPGGLLALEIGETQGEDVARLVRQAGFAQVAVHPDLSGSHRVVTGLWAG